MGCGTSKAAPTTEEAPLAGLQRAELTTGSDHGTANGATSEPAVGGTVEGDRATSPATAAAETDKPPSSASGKAMERPGPEAGGGASGGDVTDGDEGHPALRISGHVVNGNSPADNTSNGAPEEAATPRKPLGSPPSKPRGALRTLRPTPQQKPSENEQAPVRESQVVMPPSPSPDTATREARERERANEKAKVAAKVDALVQSEAERQQATADANNLKDFLAVDGGATSLASYLPSSPATSPATPSPVPGR